MSNLGSFILRFHIKFKFIFKYLSLKVVMIDYKKNSPELTKLDNSHNDFNDINKNKLERIVN